MREQILIRADGSIDIGMGHIVRCIALAHILRSEFEITFISRENPPNIVNEILDAGFSFIQINSESEFFDLIEASHIVVLDDYTFDRKYQENVKGRCSKLVFVDDLHQTEFLADLIINHAPAVKAEDYTALPTTEFALGLKYALLRPAFLEQAQRERTYSDIRSAVICFGGGDYKNLTKVALQTVVKYKEFTSIRVITGTAYKYLGDLRQILKSDSRILHFHEVTSEEMVDHMVSSELAIVPSSGILFEAIASGCRVISGTYAMNQKIVFARFLALGSFFNARNFSQGDLDTAVKEALDKSGPVERLIDGKSGQRILKKFISLTLNMRSIRENDCELLYNWANDSEVRKNALDPTFIEWDAHVRWFNNALDSDKVHIFVLERNKVPVGQVRFNMEGESFLIDYSVGKEFRGKGYGTILIEKGLKNMVGKNFKAVVESWNTGSLRVFQSLNFRETDSFVQNHKKYTVFEFNTANKF